MKKQIAYSKFIPRIFSTCLDMFILSLASSPLAHFLQHRFFVWIFNPYLIKHGINASDKTVLLNVWQSEDFRSYITLSDFISYVGLCSSIQLTLIATYFIYFWTTKGWTPGKYVTGMKIVDENTLGKITIGQAVKRLFSSSLFFFGVFLMFFTEKSQMLHDKIAGTLVVKR